MCEELQCDGTVGKYTEGSVTWKLENSASGKLKAEQMNKKFNLKPFDHKFINFKSSKCTYFLAIR